MLTSILEKIKPEKPNIRLNSNAVKDYPNDGPLNHEALSKAQDFEIRNGHEPKLLSFTAAHVTVPR